MPPEEYVESESINIEPKNKISLVIRKTVVIAIVLGVAFLLPRLFPGTRTVDIEQFQKVVQEKGYTIADTTDELRESWKVGSMMKDAVSFNDGNIRIDFCIMDTADSANALYEGMTLPVSNGEKQEHNGMVHELYSVENDTLYVAKIRMKDTVMYVSAKVEYKSEVMELLKELGYWKE